MSGVPVLLAADTVSVTVEAVLVGAHHLDPPHVSFVAVTTAVPGVVVTGHGVASGRNGDPRFPGGTIAMQTPHLAAAGVDLSGFHPATVNLSVTPMRLVIASPAITVHDLRWHRVEPPEDFSFVDCRIGHAPDDLVAGLVYHPHPDTKPEHHQPDTVVEVLAPYLAGVAAGVGLWLAVDPTQAHFEPTDTPGHDPAG